MNFEEYLISKKIDSAAYKSAEPDRWHEWNTIFVELSPSSFTAQKLYLINPIRRKYPLKSTPLPPKMSDSADSNVAPKPQGAKPVFKPKIK